MRKIADTGASGGWDADVGFRGRAQVALERAREWNQRLLEIWEDPEIHKGALSDDQRTRIRGSMDSFRLYADAAVLYSALAAESVMNFYGVVRFGERFYEEYFESMRPAQKVAALAASCQNVLLEKDDPILANTTRLFKLRNALAHPKTREVTDVLELKGRVEHLRDAEECSTALDRFLAEFVKVFPDSAWIASNA